MKYSLSELNELSKTNIFEKMVAKGLIPKKLLKELIMNSSSKKIMKYYWKFKYSQKEYAELLEVLPSISEEKENLKIIEDILSKCKSFNNIAYHFKFTKFHADALLLFYKYNKLDSIRLIQPAYYDKASEILKYMDKKKFPEEIFHKIFADATYSSVKILGEDEFNILAKNNVSVECPESIFTYKRLPAKYYFIKYGKMPKQIKEIEKMLRPIRRNCDIKGIKLFIERFDGETKEHIKQMIKNLLKNRYPKAIKEIFGEN